ncbi:MAG: UDP-3-O-acyl-N-acetylglucosamine deacetylase [Waddliaceae bacterium]
MRKRKQRTLKKAVEYSGIGVHTGRGVTVRFCPKESGGIVFQRTDLPGKPEISARLENVCDTNRSTTLGKGEIRIHTVEHLLAALRGFRIDHLLIEITSIEPPIGDGSAGPFVKMIEEAGVQELASTCPVFTLDEPVYWSEDECHIVALPSDFHKISYTLSYPDSGPLEAQFSSLEITEDSFKNELANARTFSRYEEVSALIDRGLIKGGSLENSIVVKDGVVLSQGGLRYSNEMARHKALDLIGDVSLVGVDFTAHIIAIRSGHKANVAFANVLSQKLYQEILS